MASSSIGKFVNICSSCKVLFQSTVRPPCYLLRIPYMSLGLRLFSSQFYRPPEKYKKRKHMKVNETKEEEQTAEEAELDKLLKDRSLPTIGGHRVFVIQPYIKWGPLKKRNTTPELQLMEAVTLIKTLRDWRVVDQKVISLQVVHMKSVFGKGVLQELKQRIANNGDISAVFVSLNTLTIRQQVALEQIFRVPVFDRFSVIMHIFKEHAQTKEAKLQIQLAQLPYLWSAIRGFNEGMSEKFGVPGSYLGGSAPLLPCDRQEVFRKREAKLKKEILELREKRAELRRKREEREIPVVAVIGYTNAGKTSLIKALTGKESLEPQDYLFATLDVSAHLGTLPTGLAAYFIDTLGFISDIPTYLIESFVATLEDAALADVIVHVRDISHPDTVAQNDNVIEILKMLKLPEEVFKNIITVGNKIDLVEKTSLQKYKDLILVSSTNLTGIDILKQELEKQILQVSDLIHMVIRVESGKPEYFWLHEYSTVVNETPDSKNNQYTFVEVIISDSVLSKFKHLFIHNHKKDS